MGIKKLFQLIESKAPEAVREINMRIYTSKKIAVDTSNVTITRPFTNSSFQPLEYTTRAIQIPQLWN